MTKVSVGSGYISADTGIRGYKYPWYPCQHWPYRGLIGSLVVLPSTHDRAARRYGDHASSGLRRRRIWECRCRFPPDQALFWPDPDQSLFLATKIPERKVRERKVREAKVPGTKVNNLFLVEISSSTLLALLEPFEPLRKV